MKPPPMREELHISSIIVQARPEAADSLAARIAGIDGAEIISGSRPAR